MLKTSQLSASDLVWTITLLSCGTFKVTD